MALSPSQILMIALIGTALISGSQCANILGLFTSISPSHLIVQMSAIKVLAENGHNVTVISIIKPTVTHTNIKVIQIALTPEDDNKLNEVLAEMAKSDNKNFIVNMFRIFGQRSFIFEVMQSVMFDQRVKDLYENQDNKFDLMFLGFFMNGYQLGLAQKLKTPIVIAAPMAPSEMLNGFIGNPKELSSVPVVSVAVEKGKTMTFGQRLQNLITSLAFRVAMLLQESKNAKVYYSLYGTDPAMPSYEEMKKNVSLIFFASNGLSEGPIRPNVPAVIEVGGIQIKDTPDPLPKDMEEFLAEAKHGAILLSLGSNMKGSFIKSDTVNKMFNVLSKLKQNVIWKWEDLENTPGKSANILYSKWLPQDDILAHPNLKLFITHAGKGGITESQYHGKPMLALPIFADQPSNAQSIVKAGFGVSLNLLTLEEEPFRNALIEVLENPKYAQAVGTFSSLYRDRPLSARQSVLFWSEYVIRHHGAPHLQSPVVHMGFIASHNLDIIVLVVSILVILLFILKTIIKFLYGKFYSSKSPKVKKH